MKQPQAFDLRAYLLGADVSGRWSVERKLLDRATGARGTFTGVVLFSETDDGGLRLREEGTVRWPASAGEMFTGPAARRYLLKPTESPSTMDMLFPDGRPFHRMGFTESAGRGEHWCEPDSYRVKYQLRGPVEFSYSWDVQGPRKNLLLESQLRRLGSTP
ncbi:DUF6314 family protein [Pseudarthrobacter sp. N5]|uniref:DUF6314 family protein n=1 Tax=Pseudarthrobacter sp. N5 TaxID=3418416 RepID=UPI003CFA494F